MIFLAGYFYKVLKFFADFVFAHLTNKIFQSHKEGKLIGIALEPDIIDLLGVFLFMSVQVPLGKGLFEVNFLFFVFI
jgi:hypothetical protein